MNLNAPTKSALSRTASSPSLNRLNSPNTPSGW